MLYNVIISSDFEELRHFKSKKKLCNYIVKITSYFAEFKKYAICRND